VALLSIIAIMYASTTNSRIRGTYCLQSVFEEFAKIRALIKHSDFDHTFLLAEQPSFHYEIRK
jgi:hypothetical protein